MNIVLKNILKNVHYSKKSLASSASYWPKHKRMEAGCFWKGTDVVSDKWKGIVSTGCSFHPDVYRCLDF